MEALVLTYRDEALRSFALSDRPLEVGSGIGADIVVHDPHVAERHLLVCRDGVDVTAFDVRAVDEPDAPRALLPGRPLPIGRHHTLVRVPEASALREERAPNTELIRTMHEEPTSLALVVGRGPSRRYHRIGPRPLTIGSSALSDLVLVDRTVSGMHARIERCGHDLLVRDLGSRNGTYVDGVRTVLARVMRGTRLRVGRTDLVVEGKRMLDAGRPGIIAASPAMRAVLEQVARVAHRSWPTLVLGESGVGKEGIARMLHAESPRRNGPYVAINAGGLPRELVESELFGHEKGAFTGASSVHRGVFEQASGGTLFLDEIGELSPELQTRLLRVIETQEIRRVGGEGTQSVDVRLVCATHRDLRVLSREQKFRADLYYRIAQVVLYVPPLVERPEDVRALAEHFLTESEPELGARRLSEEAMEALLAYRWPGNVRELKSVVRGAALETPGGVLDRQDIEAVIQRLSGEALQPTVDRVLDRHGGNLSAAARSLGVPRTTLRDRVRRSEPPDK